MTIPFFFLPVDKPVGWTSHDAVAKIRGLVRKSFPKGTKVGHTGTLDPFASGLLLLAVGKATRFADEVHTLPKTYCAIVVLGQTTDTLDIDGKVIDEANVPIFNQDDLNRLAIEFTGTLQQVPPQFSAKKVDGVRSYTLAREGRAVALKPSQISVFNLKLKQIDERSIQLEVNCSTGTYIRSLARDLAEKLGSIGYLKELRRISVGESRVDKALSFSTGDSQQQVTLEDIQEFACPVSHVLPLWPEVVLPFSFLKNLLQGRSVVSEQLLPKQFLGYIRQKEKVIAVFKCLYDSELRTVQSKMICFQ